MKELTISKEYERAATRVMKVTGFTERELSELNSMDYREMKEKILEMLDDLNYGVGTCWHNGYGVYNAWIREGAVFIEIGNSCD